jgi:hypothetical protein
MRHFLPALVACALPLVLAASCGTSGTHADIGGAEGSVSTTASGMASGGGPAVTSGSTGGAASTTAGSGGARPDGGDGGDAGSLPQGTLIGSFTGVNGIIADDPAVLAPLGTVREYHNWGWICDNYATGPAYPDMLYTFMNFAGWDWDTFFSDLKAQGVSGFPAVQGSVPWMNNEAIPPVLAGADPTAAASYVAHADAMFQIAARYGAASVPDAQLKLQPTQTRLSGLGTVHYFEDFNEEDNAPAFTPAAMAAMASADYDGDQGKLGATIGIKNADPSAQLVMGGLSGAYPSSKWQASITTYLDGMRTWAAANRGGSFPADVLNIHYYSFAASTGAAAPSPEADGVQAKLAAIVAYRNQYLPGKQVWWTEFGYDTDAQSPLHAPALGANTAFIVQGQWLVRAFLAALAAGVDRATLFELDDTCNVADSTCMAAQQFTTCGLVDGAGVKKASWYFVAAFRARLATMVFTGNPDSGQAGVSIAAFKDTAGPGGALVLWSPTSSASVVSGYSLALPAGATTATAVALADQQQNGVETSLTPAGGKVTLDVSETPTIVLVDAM